MSKPTDDLSDENLHQGLATGEYEGRDALVAQEILRRRHEERARTGSYRLGLVGAWAAAFWLWIKLGLKPRVVQAPLAIPRRNFSPNAQFPAPTL
jgi:hypothetical protein